MTGPSGRVRVRVRVRLPYPPAGLSPNRRLHRLARARLTADYRRLTALLAGQDWRQGRERRAPLPLARAVLVVTAHPPDGRRRDLDNVLSALKAAVDGLVDAGLLADDAAAHLPAIVVRAGDVVAGGAVDLTLIGYGGDGDGGDDGGGGGGGGGGRGRGHGGRDGRNEPEPE